MLLHHLSIAILMQHNKPFQNTVVQNNKNLFCLESVTGKFSWAISDFHMDSLSCLGITWLLSGVLCLWKWADYCLEQLVSTSFFSHIPRWTSLAMFQHWRQKCTSPFLAFAYTTNAKIPKVKANHIAELGIKICVIMLCAS